MGDAPDVDVSVIIPALNAAGWLGNQLEALRAQDFGGTWEVVVSDNGSTDATPDVVRAAAESFPVPLRLADASDRRGICHGRNVGAKASRGRHLMFCDSDDRVAPTWVRAGHAALLQCGVAAGYSRLLTPDHDLDAPLVNSGHFQGNNFGVRRSLYFQIGGFDESLPPYGNDDGEFRIRLAKAGAMVAAAPDMLLYFQPTTSTRVLMRKIYLAGLAESLVWSRHPDVYPDAYTPRALVKRVRQEVRRALSGPHKARSLTRALILAAAFAKGTRQVKRVGGGTPVLVFDDPRASVG